nr:NUDIX domain-containing protein [Pedobacter sp. ASV2]
MKKQNRKLMPAVAAAIFNNRNEILLQKRSDVNKWGIVSGHVEFGESIQEAILREIKEELNVSAKIIRFIGVYSAPESQTYFYGKDVVQYVTSYFQVELTEDFIPDFTNDETLQLKFFPVEKIPQELALMNANWLTDALCTTDKVFIR